MEKFDLFVPFGSFCITSTQLRVNRLQLETLPFDWIGYLNLRDCLNLLQNKFDGLLVKKELTLLGKHPQADCYQYRNAHNCLFFHDFYQTPDLNITFDNVKAKYNRRIRRLYESIKKARSVLLLHCIREQDAILDDKDIIAALNELKQIYPGKRFKLLYIILRESQTGYQSSVLTPEITKVDMVYNPQDDIMSRQTANSPYFEALLKNYGLSRRTKFNNWKVVWTFRAKKLALKLLSSLMPVKSWRQKLKRRYKTDAPKFYG